MEQRLAQQPLDEDARVHFLFTLGKAQEDQRQFESAFAYYEQACAIQRMRISYDPVDTEIQHQRIRGVFTAPFLAARTGQGCADPAPIFIKVFSQSPLDQALAAAAHRGQWLAKTPRRDVPA